LPCQPGGAIRDGTVPYGAERSGITRLHLKSDPADAKLRDFNGRAKLGKDNARQSVKMLDLRCQKSDGPN